MIYIIWESCGQEGKHPWRESVCRRFWRTLHAIEGVTLEMKRMDGLHVVCAWLSLQIKLSDALIDFRY